MGNCYTLVMVISQLIPGVISGDIHSWFEIIYFPHYLGGEQLSMCHIDLETW